MPANVENSAVATGLERSVFILIPKKGNGKECSNYSTIALISHAGNVAERSYSMFKVKRGNSSKVRSSGCTLLGQL